MTGENKCKVTWDLGLLQHCCVMNGRVDGKVEGWMDE